jgi:hypothetical protein
MFFVGPDIAMGAVVRPLLPRLPSPLARGCTQFLRAASSLRRGLLRIILATAGCTAPVDEPPARGVDAFAAQVSPDYVRD